MTTAAVYARRSTAEQDASIGSQMEECEEFATSRGWEVAVTYADTASGWKEDTSRPQFDLMMREASRGKFDVLVVWEVSRLSRQEDDRSALAIIWDLRGLGIEVHSVIDPRTGVKLADDMNLLIKSHMAKEESDTKSKRVKRGKRRGALNGVYQGARAPYGHRLLSDKRPHRGRLINFYEVDPETAPIVRRIVDEYLRGESPQTIADGLTADGIDPPDGGRNHRYKRRKEPVWHQSTIRSLLGNPLLAGFATYKGERIKDCPCATLEDIAAKGDRREVAVETWEECAHEWVRSVNIPGVIEPELWERVQRVIEVHKDPAKGRRGNHSGRGRHLATAERFLLTGMVWCGNCRERIGIRGDEHEDGSPYDYYRCRGRRIRARCELPHIPREDLDEAIRQHFIETFVDAIDVQATIEQQRELHLARRDERAGLLREEMSEVEAELDKDREFRERFNADYSAGSITPDQWSRLEDEVGGRIEQGETALANLKAALAEVERDFTTEDIDRVLDHINVLREMVQGQLTADSTPALNLQLREVFEEFRISSRGQRIIVEPKLRTDWLPEGKWRQLDFADDETAGIEVVEYVGAVMKKVDLTEGLFTDNS